MRKALVNIEDDSIVSIGSKNYDNIEPNHAQVDLTDWPMLDGEKALKEDVSYSDILVDGKHFILIWLDIEEKETYIKKKKIYDMAIDKIISYGYSTQIRDYGESKGVARGLIPETTLTESEDNNILMWINELGLLHKNLDLSTININDICETNTAIFPAIPIDLKLNGFLK